MTRFARVPVRAASAPLTLTALRVLIALGAHAGRDGQAWPSLSTLSLRTGVDRRKISTATAELEHAGFIRRSRRKADHGDHTSTLYEMVYEDWPAAPIEVPDGPCAGAMAGPRTGATLARQQGAPGGAPTRAQTAQPPETDQRNTPDGTEFPDSALAILLGLVDD
ncbi:MAG: helix-turn-helix domain-containing protein [Pseudomonadota bacterium]